MVEINFVTPFINSAMNAFGTMALTAPRVGQPFYKNGVQLQNNDISAIIGLTGRLTGWVALCFQKSAALKVASNLFGENKEVIDAEVHDAVGEIANIVAGGAKAEFFQKGFSYKIATPTVVIGSDHVLIQGKDSSCIVIPFHVNEGDFSLLVCIDVVTDA